MFLQQVAEAQKIFMTEMKIEMLGLKSANEGFSKAIAEISQGSKKAANEFSEGSSAEKERQRDSSRDKERHQAAKASKSTEKESLDWRSESNCSDGSGLMGQLLLLKEMPQFQGVININAQPTVFKAQQKRCRSCNYLNPQTERFCLDCDLKF